MVSSLRARTLPAHPQPSPATKSRSKGKGKSGLISKPTKPLSQPRKSSKSPHRINKACTATSESTSRSHSPFIWKEPANPQATLLGLPTELRLQIYDHVFHTTLIHVHRHEQGEVVSGIWRPPRFFWTACRQPNPDHPMLCANPKYSALCHEEDRCTYRPDDPPESSGAVALRRSCRLIYQETQDHARRVSTISILPVDLAPWLEELEAVAPKQLEQIRSITLMGADSWRTPFYLALTKLKILKSLEVVAFQGQVNKFSLLHLTQATRNAPAVRLQHWQMLNWLKMFPCNVKVVAEGLVWNKHRPRWAISPDKDHQIVIRVVRDAYEGNEDAPASLDDDHITTDVHRSDLIN